MGDEAMNAITSIKPMTNNNVQKAHPWPATRLFLMSNHTSTETTTEHELYRIVSALSDAMTLASRPAISALSNTITRIGESAPKTTTLVSIKAASRKLMPHQMVRIVEPDLSMCSPPVMCCVRRVGPIPQAVACD
jgi:hypothetical protein